MTLYITKNAHMAEWSKAVVLSFFLRRIIHKHHYRKMREFEPHCEQSFAIFYCFASPIVSLCCQMMESSTRFVWYCADMKAFLPFR